MAWTAPRTWTTGELVSASLMNTHVRDNFSHIITSGLLTITTFGTHDLTAGGTGAHTLRIRNSTAGIGNYAALELGNNAGALAYFYALSSTYTTSGRDVASGAVVMCSGAGGLSIAATDASGDIRIYSGGASERGKIYASGGWSIGSTSDPGDSGVLHVQKKILLPSRDIGVGVAGAYIQLGRNTNGSNGGGYLEFVSRNGTSYYVWVDVNGKLRINTTIPDNTNDVNGTVVGTQT